MLNAPKFIRKKIKITIRKKNKKVRKLRVKNQHLAGSFSRQESWVAEPFAHMIRRKQETSKKEVPSPWIKN